MMVSDGVHARRRFMWLYAGSALLVACVLLLGQRWHSNRELLLDSLAVEAALLASIATAAVAFDDDRAAAEILAALENSPGVVEAALYRVDGSRLATFLRRGADPGLPGTAGPGGDRQMDWFEARLAVPVQIDGRQVGAIALRATLAGLYEDLAYFFGGLLVIVAVAGGLAALAGRHLRGRMLHAERELERLALYDQPTGLPNRYAFTRLLEQTAARHQRDNRSSALLYADLDGFKKVNDMFGHHTGDRVLEEVGARLRQVVRGTDVVARLGGDEFAILLLDIHAPDDAARIAAQLITAIAKPLETGQGQAYVGLSVGIALVPGDGRSAAELMHHADLAMYHAKKSGRGNSQFFADHIGSSVRQRLDMEAALRVALAQDQLYLVYQPQVSAATGAMVGLEALVRWRHPAQGVIPPAEFIPVAEESGLILELGRRVLALACHDIAHLRSRGCPLPVAVNISARQLSRSRLIDDVTGALAAHGLSSADLALELTESVIMDQPEETGPILADLAGQGLRIAIDDFGTGYSSLAYLRRLPVDKVKIDRSFVRELPDDAESRAIVAAIIELAHALQLTVVAEGAETAAQADCLRLLGCDLLQGYFTGRPMELGPLQDALAAQAADDLGGEPGLVESVEVQARSAAPEQPLA